MSRLLPRFRSIPLAAIMLCALLAPLSAPAQELELRVLDPLGLVRAVKRTAGPSEIVVDVSPEQGGAAGPPPTASLTNLDGLAPEKTASLEAPGRYRFPRVESGTWRLDLGGSRLIVTEVNVM